MSLPDPDYPNPVVLIRKTVGSRPVTVPIRIQVQVSDDQRYANKADIARIVDRDPARVSAYWKAGQLPLPDAWTVTNKPLWKVTTITEWWETRNAVVPVEEVCDE